MKKQLGVLASLLFLSATAFMWTGCCDSNYCNSEPECIEQPYAQPYGSTDESVCEPQQQVGYQESASFGQMPSFGESRQDACEQPQACEQQPACQPVCQPAQQPVCAPKCQPVRRECGPVCKEAPPIPCEPLCKKLEPCKHPNQNELRCFDGITVSARNPKMCLLGEQYPLEFDICACQDVCDVVVTAHLPEGVTFVKSVPEAKVEGRKLTWYIGSMDQGQHILAKVFVKCECEGELCACFCATATPVRFCSLLCAKPVLICEKCAPEQVCPGDAVNYTITVTNRGSCAAEDVVVTDNLPEGVQGPNCQSTLTYKLGTIQPCESKTVNICTTAVKRGKFTNTAVVTACNADSTSCQATTCICCCAIECFKCGPKEQQIGKNADYQITVVNTGDLPLTEVVVTDSAPSSTAIVNANGATVDGNKAVWRLKELKPGEKVTFNTTLSTCTPGCFTNKVYVSTCQGCNTSCEATTRWRGRPALNVCVTETEDAICIGDSTTYIITVVNQGSEADSNVVVNVNFPDEVQPISASGDSAAQINGQNVRFAPYPSLGARQTAKFSIVGKAKQSGDGRVKVELSSDSIKTPIVQQESTIVN